MGLWKNKLNPIYNRKQRNDAETENRESAENQASNMLADATAVADADRAEYEALQAKQLADNKAFKKRGTTMQGGGRKGLMASGNAQGVL